jgi:hypothetical protein
MNTRPCIISTLAAFLPASLSLGVHAGSLRCDGEIISVGDSVQHLLDTCGNPQSREGSDWLYRKPGSLPVVVTVGRDMVMFVRTRDEANAFTEHPMGDPP